MLPQSGLVWFLAEILKPWTAPSGKLLDLKPGSSPVRQFWTEPLPYLVTVQVIFHCWTWFRVCFKQFLNFEPDFGQVCQSSGLKNQVVTFPPRLCLSYMWRYINADSTTTTKMLLAVAGGSKCLNISDAAVRSQTKVRLPSWVVFKAQKNWAKTRRNGICVLSKGTDCHT